MEGVNLSASELYAFKRRVEAEATRRWYTTIYRTDEGFKEYVDPNHPVMMSLRVCRDILSRCETEEEAFYLALMECSPRA